MASRYWVGGSGTWDGTSTANWSATTGGASGASAPTTADDVVFDSNSGTAATVTVASTAVALNTTVNKSDINISLSANSTLATTAGTFSLISGTLTLNSYILTVGIFRSSGSSARTFAFGTGKIQLNWNGSNAKVVDCGTLSNLTVSGTPLMELVGTGTSNYTIQYGTSNGTAARVCSFSFLKTTAATFILDGAVFKDLTFNASNATLKFGNDISLYGNFTVTSISSITDSGKISFIATSGTQDIDFNGYSHAGAIIVNAPGGTVRLQSALTLTGTGTSDGLTLTAGTFNANNYNVTIPFFNSSNTNVRTLTMGSGTWSISGSSAGTPVWQLGTTTNLTFNKDTANIIFTSTDTGAGSTRTFAGGGLTYNKLTIGGATGTSTVEIQGTNTFSELAATKAVAHTITFFANQTVGNWSIKGTSGNVVTLNSNSPNIVRTITKTGGGFLTGIDYLSIDSVTGSPTDTWYIGSNSTYVTSTNIGYGMFTTQRANNAVVVLTSTTSTTWTVPSDWNNVSNAIHLIGGGGGGSGSKTSGANNASAGGGGGSGGYTRLNNQVLSKGSSITYQCGSAGAGGAAGNNGTGGGTTSWNSGASTAGGGGGGSCNAATPSSTGGAAGTGTTFNGGVGGAGSTTTARTTTGCGGGGGAGAGGPNGAGKNGGIGFSSTTAASIAGGGGGGNGGGTAGGNASAAVGGTGGNNSTGVGGGGSNAGGAVGGGGGGSVSAASYGGAGIEVFGVGSGGGAGGGDDAARTTNVGGTFGGGGGGAGIAINGSTLAGASGSQGAIIITYVPSTGNPGNFFLLFN